MSTKGMFTLFLAPYMSSYRYGNDFEMSGFRPTL